MNNAFTKNLSLIELCQITLMPRNIILEIINHGIIEPIGNEPEGWQFDFKMLSTARKAQRLQRDLEIDWSGVAFAISLIDELEQLRGEKECLKLRLSHYELCSD
jgi:chaperone modulatory protein CbpM